MAYPLAKRIFLTFFILVFFLFTGCQKDSQEEEIPSPDNQGLSEMLYGKKQELSLEQAQENLTYLFEQQKHQELLKEVKNFRQQFKEQENQWDFYEGLAWFGLEELEKSKTFLKKAEKVYPYRVLYYYGHLARKEKNFDLALKYYQEAYQNLKEPEILSSMADLYFENNQIDKAISFYEKAIPNLPDSYLDRYFLATAYFQKSQFGKAEKLLHQALAINGRFKRAYIALSSIAEKKGQEIDKLYYASRAYLLGQEYSNVVSILENKPIIQKDLRLFKFYIISLIRTGIHEKAKEMQKQGEKLFPQDSDIKMYGGMLLNLTGKRTEALNYFQKIYNQFPDNFNIIVAYADLLVEEKEVKKAIPLLEKALQIDPSSKSYRYKLAEIYRKENQEDKEYYHRGVLYLFQGMPLEAKEALMRVKNPFYPDLHYFYLGQALEKELPDEALNYYKKAIKENPKMEKAYLEGAYLYFKKGEKNQALKLLKSYPQKSKEIEELKKFMAK